MEHLYTTMQEQIEWKLLNGAKVQSTMHLTEHLYLLLMLEMVAMDFLPLLIQEQLILVTHLQPS